MPSRMDALPPDMRSKVRSCMAKEQQQHHQRNKANFLAEKSSSGGGRKITVAVDDDHDREVRETYSISGRGPYIL